MRNVVLNRKSSVQFRQTTLALGRTVAFFSHPALHARQGQVLAAMGSTSGVRTFSKSDDPVAAEECCNTVGKVGRVLCNSRAHQTQPGHPAVLGLPLPSHLFAPPGRPSIQQS